MAASNRPISRLTGGACHVVGVGTLSALAACCAAVSATAEPAIGQFELKTLASSPGLLEFQSQNAYSWGQPSRWIESAGPDGIEIDENSVVRQRHALELEMGFTNYLKMRVGIEFEKERLDEPPTIGQVNDFEELKLTELGAELIAILIPRRGNGAGLGFVAEFERPLDREEPDALILGSILEFRSGLWLAAAVPMVVHDFGGNPEEEGRGDDKWDFAYAAQFMYTFSRTWSLAIEGYGTVERIDSTGHPSESARLFGDFDQHRVGTVLYYTHAFGDSRELEPKAPGSASLSDTDEEDEGVNVSVGIGLLLGLNENTPDQTLKLSIEVDF